MIFDERCHACKHDYSVCIKFPDGAILSEIKSMRFHLNETINELNEFGAEWRCEGYLEW